MGVTEQIAAAEFLGREFATWLLWMTETNGNKVSIDGMEEFQLWFESPVELAADYGDALVVSLRGGSPLESPEARRALREGKTLAKARVRIISRNQTYTFGLDAGRMNITGLKLPLPPGASADDLLLLRLELLQEFEAFMQQLLEAYFAKRFDDKAWAAERKRIAGWIKGFDS